MPRRGKMFVEKMTPQKQSAIGTKFYVAPLGLNIILGFHLAINMLSRWDKFIKIKNPSTQATRGQQDTRS